MADLLLVKLGGSLITDKTRPDTPRRKIIQRLGQELARAKEELAAGPDGDALQLVVGHGSGSFGHVAAQAAGFGGASGTDTPAGTLENEAQRRGVSAVQSAAATLHRMVVDALAEAGAAPFSLAPSSFAVASSGELKTLHLRPLQRALDLGLTPVVYGDVVTDLRWGACIASTERVLTEILVRLRRQHQRTARIVWAGATGGIYDAEGEAVPRVTAANFRAVWKALGAPQGTDVTGGMALRLDTAWRLAGQGVESVLIDGREPDHLRRAVLGAAVPEDVPGTAIPARGTGRRGRM